MDDEQSRSSLLSRVLHWWRGETTQGVALAFVIVLCLGGWQVPIFSLLAGSNISRVGALFALALAPYLVVFSIFAAMTHATIRRSGIGAAISVQVYSVFVLSACHLLLPADFGSLTSFAVFIACALVLSAALCWCVFSGYDRIRSNGSSRAGA